MKDVLEGADMLAANRQGFRAWNDHFWANEGWRVVDPDGFPRHSPDWDRLVYTADEFRNRAYNGSTIQWKDKAQAGGVAAHGPKADGFFHNTEEEAKPTNPKDVLGSTKIPIHLVSPAFIAVDAIGKLNGALKYGQNNYRPMGVRFSIYYDAVMRHMMNLLDGEFTDPDDMVPHFAAAAASLDIMVDAYFNGQLEDDRNIVMNGQPAFRRAVEVLTPMVKKLQDHHAGRDPKHWLIDDSDGVALSFPSHLKRDTMGSPMKSGIEKEPPIGARNEFGHYYIGHGTWDTVDPSLDPTRSIMTVEQVAKNLGRPCTNGNWCDGDGACEDCR